MSAVEFKIRGTRKMQAEIKKLINRYPVRLKKALRLEAEFIMTDSKDNFVPVDIGTLKSSGRVGEVVRKGKALQIPMSYGGAAAPYALAIHEHPSSHSPPSWDGKTIDFSPAGHGRKYLERPMRNAQAGMAARVARSVKVGK